MKEQYVGDIGDFGKVLILKHLAGCGFKIGINWVLTENDDKNDGKHRDYVDNNKYGGVNCLCCCDKEIFERIKPLAEIEDRNNRKLEDLEKLIKGFSPSVIFYSDKYIDGPKRIEIEKDALNKLTSDLAELVFFDPDNGIDGYEGSSSKHVYLNDLQRYWDEQKQSLLIYHHFGRKRDDTHEKQIEEKIRLLKEQFSGSSVYPYRLCRGTARVYLLCIQPHHQGKILGKTTIPSLKPLMMTKKQWHKIGKHCNKDHSAKLTYSCNTTLFLNGSQ